MSRAPRSADAQKFWGSDDSQTPILHVDMDAFFVSVELLAQPQLAGKPVAVGGQERGVIAAASYEARQYGVNSAMSVGQAKKRCPQLIILPSHHEKYAEVSARIMAILRSYTPLVEQLSVDEAFLDVSGAQRLFGSPVKIAQDLRQQIRQSVGLAASVGIAASKHVAKIASAHAKPDGLLLVPADRTRDFLQTLPVGALWGVGDKTREVLERQGITGVADIVAAGPQRLMKILGQAHGMQLFELAMGRDQRAVTPERVEKSISREQTFFDPVIDEDKIYKTLLWQSHDVASRLRAHNFYGRTVSIKVRYSDFSTITRSVTLGVATQTGADIYQAVRSLMEQVTIGGMGIRLLGVRVSQLSSSADGVQLTIDDDERRSRAEAAMDVVRKKYGPQALGQASLL